jgi:hypothetical protein
LWSDALAGIDENFDDLPVPADMVVPVGWTSDSDSDEIARRQVTPEMRAGLDPSQRQMLANLGSEVRKETDPSKSMRLMSRMATAISFAGIPVPLVLSTVAEAMKEHDPQPFHELYFCAHMYLLDYRDQSARKPATPEFNYDEYGPMAAYIHSSPGLEALTALSDREFFDNDERISTHAVNSIIDAQLRNCSIWDPIRGVNVAVSNRLINEVRGAMARMWPRLTDHNPDDPSDKFPSLAGPSYAQRVASFGDNQLCLDAAAWTSSASLWQAWIALCASRSEPPGASSTFFKELPRWSGGRIQRSKKGKEPHRVPGYSGIRLT